VEGRLAPAAVGRVAVSAIVRVPAQQSLDSKVGVGEGHPAFPTRVSLGVPRLLLDCSLPGRLTPCSFRYAPSSTHPNAPHTGCRTRTGPLLLRGASIDVNEIFVPFGGPEAILLKPARADAAPPALDPVGARFL
jgi:hypothetical protein